MHNTTSVSTPGSAPPSIQAIHARLLEVMPHVVASLRLDAPFNVSGGDSIDFVEFLCAIDTDYGVRLTTDDIAPLQTVGELLALVDRRATKRPLSSP
ncbi:MAG: acyl carrier protein [Opitutaceae bacterium]